MNFTKRYFKLRDDIVQAINDSALPPLAAEQCLRELRAELLTVVERAAGGCKRGGRAG